MLLLPVFALLLAVVVMAVWARFAYSSWSTRVRRLLEQEGFHVRHMELRWLTRGPFPDMRLPGMRGSGERLIRVIAEDREHRPRVGWVRWRPKLPWEDADRWAVRWDGGPFPDRLDRMADVPTRGLSTAAFYAFNLALLIPVLLLIRHFWQLAGLR